MVEKTLREDIEIRVLEYKNSKNWELINRLIERDDELIQEALENCNREVKP